MTEIPIPKVKLTTGAEIPAIGLGTWSGRTDEERATSLPWLITGLKAGYRHLDTAYGYGTEKYVGEAVRQSGIPREEIFITTKLPDYHHGQVEKSIDESLKRAGFDYYDLYLVHFPIAMHSDDLETDDGQYKVLAPEESPTINETWAGMEKVLASGKVKAIGVSNFSIKTINQLLKTAKVVPAVNQVEMHPYLAQNELVTYCKEKGIVVTAYSPSGWAPVRGDPTIKQLAEKYKVTPTQVTLSWHVSRGITAVPGSKNTERQKENLRIIKLEPEDIKLIDKLDRNERMCNKAGADGLMMGWTYEQLGW